jgi:hypothetical protein
MTANLRTQILTQLESSPETKNLRSRIESSPEVWIKSFVQAVDESPYALHEWLDALLLFEKWGAQHQHGLSLEKQHEYLQCCIDGLKTNAPTLPLKDVLHYYLEKNGVDPKGP